MIKEIELTPIDEFMYKVAIAQERNIYTTKDGVYFLTKKEMLKVLYKVLDYKILNTYND